MKKIAGIILILSLILNSWLLYNLFGKTATAHIPAETKQRYPHLSQKILSDYDRDLLINFVDLRKELRATTKDYGADFTFYFEYLPTGVSIGVNEKIEFFSASLLKVPTVMAYFHHKEQENTKDDPLVTIEKKHLDDHFGALFKRGEGSKVNLSEAVELALKESDNTAINLIIDQIPEDSYVYIFNGLDINVRFENSKRQILLTAKSYSSILKALFFSSLLSKENSNYILELLTQSKFTDKLPAGVPGNIPVAHKIGTYENVDTPIYSDCGIVYVPKRQYLLCMASRSDEATARERMKTISKMVYDFVSTTAKPE